MRGKVGKGEIISYERLLLARAVRVHVATIASLAGITAAGDKAAEHLNNARVALLNVARECARAGERFEATRRFRAECEAAARLDSVEDMIRRRDDLLAQLRARKAR